MTFIDLLRRALRSLLNAKTRTILTAFAIAVGAFALTLTLGASNGAQSYADTIVAQNFDPTELIVTSDASLFDATDSSKPQTYNANFGSITTATGAARQVKMLSDTDLARLKSVPGVTDVRAALSVSLQYITRDGQKQYVGTAQAYDAYRPPELLAGHISQPLQDHTIILPEGFVSALGFNSAADAIGKEVRLAVRKQADQATLLATLAQGSSRVPSGNTMEQTFKVIAVNKKPSTLIQPGTSLYLNITAHDLSELNDFTTKDTANYHKYLSAYVKVTDGQNQDKLVATQSAVKKLGYGAQSVLDTQKAITQVINVLQGIVTVFGLIAVIASVFGIVNTMYISVLQRTREIGLMKALGMHKKDISKLFLIEAALIGVLGGIIGSGLAVVIGVFANPFISSHLSLGSEKLLQFHASQIAGLIVALAIVAIIAGLFPARKASRLDPIEALRTE